MTSSDPVLVLLTAVAFGMRHAFDRDHVTAVTHFISLEPDPLRSAWFGFRWALGHAITVLGLGALILVLHLKLDPRFQRTAELAVGISLVGLGIWRLVLLAREGRHTHPHQHRVVAHAHAHTHEPGREHVHRLAPTIVGMVHGAAGTAEVLVLIPITMISAVWLAYAYIGLFSLGCAFTMSIYGYLAGRFYRRATETGRRVYRSLVFATAMWGIVLGVIWIGRNLT